MLSLVSFLFDNLREKRSDALIYTVKYAYFKGVVAHQLKITAFPLNWKKKAYKPKLLEDRKIKARDFLNGEYKKIEKNLQNQKFVVYKYLKLTSLATVTKKQREKPQIANIRN